MAVRHANRTADGLDGPSGEFDELSVDFSETFAASSDLPKGSSDRPATSSGLSTTSTAQRLEVILDQIKGFAAEQAALTASRQIATSRVEYLLAQGRKLATVLRTSVREHYGNRSEKIAEFGLQPLRPRPRRSTDNPLPQPE